MQKILTFLIKPFTNHFILFCSIFITTTLIELYGDVFYPSHSPYRPFLTIIRGIVECYSITLVYSFLSHKIKKLFLIFIFSLICPFFIIDLFTVFGFNITFDGDIVSIILGTNANEIKEFASTYISTKILFVSSFFIALLFFLHYLSKKEILINQKKATFCLLIVILSFIANMYVGGIGMTFRKIQILLAVPSAPDLSQYLSNPDIEIISKQPQNIVIVIGESFSKTHSSLYQYSKKTNPFLSQLRKDSLLFVFNNVKTGGLHTIHAFEKFMSTYRSSDKNKKKWYECVTLPEIIKHSSYKSIWISNQSRYGIYDNIVSRYAELCDSMIFMGDQYSGAKKIDLDEVLLKPIRNISKDSLKVFFIHLMESHPNFEKRYPSSFNKYKEIDYIEYPIAQRKNLASYDNSILYNDSIVYEIIKCFKDRESILFYFTDHSLDIYESSNDYCGHAKRNNPVSVSAGSNIPFMVFMSSSYQKSYPNIVNEVKANTNSSFSTDELPYTIMDIMGTKFKRNSDVQKYSLFKLKQSKYR